METDLPNNNEISNTWVTLATKAVAEPDSFDEILRTTKPTDLAHDFSLAGVEAISKLFSIVSPEQGAKILAELPEGQAVEIIENIDCSKSAVILSLLESPDRIQFVSALPEELAEEITSHMPAEEAEELVEKAAWPEFSSGALMSGSYLRMPYNSTVKASIEYLESEKGDVSDSEVQYLYTVSDEGNLAGVVRIRDLLFSASNTRLASIMIQKAVSVSAEETLDDLAELFEQHSYLGVPVTSASGELIGVVKRRTVNEALTSRDADTFLKSKGIVGGDELRSMPLFFRSRRRLSWLSINIILNAIAACVIASFEDTLASVIALAVFLPVISDMSGCSGSQALAVSIRELTMGVIRPGEVLRVCFSELKMGLVNGAVLGSLIALVTWLWKGNIYLGLVVGGALGVNTVIAVLIGGSLPLILKKLDKDPALASGPILTTVTDTVGFFLVLSLATVFINYLR